MNLVTFIFGVEGNWEITFPDFPGCVSAGASFEKCFTNGREALHLHAESLVGDNLPLPNPMALEKVLADPEFAFEVSEAKLVTLLEFTPPSRAVKVTITLEDALLKRLNARAEAEGYTRSGFIADAVRDRLKQAS